MSWPACRKRRASTSPIRQPVVRSRPGRDAPSRGVSTSGDRAPPPERRASRSTSRQRRSSPDHRSFGRSAHPYPRTLSLGPPSSGRYSFEEVFAEKLRAMGERGRPRDLYDIVNLYWRPDLRQHAELIRSTLDEKCRTKGVAVPTMALVAAAQTRAELESEWANMLGHQLPALPPFEQFWGELPGVVRLARGQARSLSFLPPSPWRPARSPDGARRRRSSTWRVGVPLEDDPVRGGQPTYVSSSGTGGTTSVDRAVLAAPERAPATCVLHGLRGGLQASTAPTASTGSKALGRRLDHSRPTYAVEFSSVGALAAPLQTRRAPTVRRPARRRSTAVAQRPPFARVD